MVGAHLNAQKKDIYDPLLEVKALFRCFYLITRLMTIVLKELGEGHNLNITRLSMLKHVDLLDAAIRDKDDYFGQS